MENISVVEALKAAGLYRNTGRIEEQMLKTILPNGEVREHKMAEIDYFDLKVFADELDVSLKHENPIIQSLFAKNAVGIANLIRVINVETGSGFKGSVGSGRQLDAVLLRAEQFYDPDVSGSMRLTWEREIDEAKDETFFEGATEDSELPMADEEGIALLGFVDFAELPCCSAWKLTYLSVAYNIQILDFGITDYQNAYPLRELKQPLFQYPKESIKGEVRYFREGTDDMQPVGLWIKMSSNLRSLGSN